MTCSTCHVIKCHDHVISQWSNTSVVTWRALSVMWSNAMVMWFSQGTEGDVFVPCLHSEAHWKVQVSGQSSGDSRHVCCHQSLHFLQWQSWTTQKCNNIIFNFQTTKQHDDLPVEVFFKLPQVRFEPMTCSLWAAQRAGMNPTCTNTGKAIKSNHLNAECFEIYGTYIII